MADSNFINRLPIIGLTLNPRLVAAVSAVAATGVLTSDNTQVTAGKKVTIGSIIYTFVAALTANAYGTRTLTSNNTNVANGATVTIGGVTYTARTNLTTNPRHLPYEYKIGANADASLNNLIAAINGAAGAGTLYSSGTEAHPYVTAGTVSAHAFAVTAKGYGATYENLATTETSATLSWNASTLGGTHTTAYEVLIGAAADDTLNNLIAAINGAAGAGTTYGTGTVAHTLVTAGTVTAHAFTVTAITAGVAGNAIAKAEDDAHLDWDGAGGFLTGGVDAVTAQTGTVEITGEGGLVTKIVGVAPAMDGVATTYTIKITDSAGVVLYTSSAFNENVTTVDDIGDSPFVVTPGDIVVVTPSVAQTDTTIEVILR